jgi:tRNA(Arg) A34 adenosine deaminase TadA
VLGYRNRRCSSRRRYLPSTARLIGCDADIHLRLLEQSAMLPVGRCRRGIRFKLPGRAQRSTAGGFTRNQNDDRELVAGCRKGSAIMRHDRNRRHLLSALTLAPFAGVWSASPAAAQPGAALPPLQQPAEPSKAAFLARARALRDQAVREGDQAYGAVVVRDGVIVGEGRNYVVLHSDPTAHSELLAVRDAARRLGTRDLSQCDVYSTATPCPMCQGALYWGRVRRVFTESTLEQGFAPKLGC